MKKAGTIALAAALLAAGFAAGRLFAGPAAPPVLAGGREVLHYACPMHPTVKAEAPGTAPCCGMALEPVYADGGPAEARSVPGTVTMGPELRQLQGVRVGEAERASGKLTLRLFGRVVPDETRVHVVDSAFEGTVREISGATTGSFVRKGERLGRVFSQDARAALQSYLGALDVIAREERMLSEAGQPAARNAGPAAAARFVGERLRALGVSDEQIREMARTSEVPSLIDIRSPVDGLVIARDFSPGRRMMPGMECFRIANLDRVWIVADVPQADVDLVRPGATARVALPGRPATLGAVVSQVPPQFDPASQTLKVRLELANPGAVLRPEMYVDVELEAERPEAVTVPAEAVLDAGVRKTVFVEAGEGRFEPREVETGWRAGGRVEIARGLSAGERIVVSGIFMVDSESQLRAATAGGPAAVPAEAAVAALAEAETPIDPVCGMTVDPAKAEAAGRTHVHGGTTYHFCADECRARFAADPERFAGRGAKDPHRHGAQ
jgi:Cu(I)/Ag(I) efflux system membrane fusion protein